MTYEQMLALEARVGSVSRGFTKDQLKKVKYQELWQDEEIKENCTICIEKFMAGDAFLMLNCNHHYHKDCIEKWLSQEKRCPCCNQDIALEDIT